MTKARAVCSGDGVNGVADEDEEEEEEEYYEDF